MKPARPHRSLQRGASLIEALVAMAIMAFGMLALAGVQTTLRVNADLAKQRAEATRIAEQQIETVRAFRTVGSGGPGGTEYDNLTTTAPATVTLPESNTVYEASTTINPQADGLHQTVRVLVTWKDRYDMERRVVVRDIVSRAAPTLSGLVSSVRKTTAPGQWKNRHPTIPVRAGDQIGNNESVFKPKEGGDVAWVFNNTTGVITRVCTVSSVSESGTLQQTDLVSCENTNAQLLAGYVRFNLRGVSLDFGDGFSGFKPIPGDTTAWVIDNSLSRIVRSCTVDAAETTASLLPADVPPGCPTTVGTVSQNIGTFDAAADPTHTLNANDAEFAFWPALNLKIELALSSTGHSSLQKVCYAVAPETFVAAHTLTHVEYFCIIYPNSSQSWAGKSTVVPLPFETPSNPNWALGTSAGTYRVCRYTKASTPYTENADHPADYSKWSATCGGFGQPSCTPVKGNLINQNFLVIDGSKTCPTDTGINPAAGDLVNSNTLQHQP
jgi:hypothetical protein